jgi:hypothetical protein
MGSKTKSAPAPAVPVLPVPETNKVLLALTPLNEQQRITVLSAAIAFFGMGNAQLNVIK